MARLSLHISVSVCVCVDVCLRMWVYVDAYVWGEIRER